MEEPGVEGAAGTRHESTPSTATTPPPPSPPRPMTPKAPSSSTIEPSTSATPATPANAAVAAVKQGEERTKDHDSMVTVRLSEPPALKVDTNMSPASTRTMTQSEARRRHSRQEVDTDGEQEEESLGQETGSEDMEERNITTQNGRSLQDELGRDTDEDPVTPMDEGDVSPTSDAEEVDWEGLQKTEDAESRDQDTDNVSGLSTWRGAMVLSTATGSLTNQSRIKTALLLARLEQENAKLATNPKSIKVREVERLQQQSPTKRPRPPSMAQLKDMVHGPTPPALRYSMLPPPPMTDLEFYAALVKDYQQTAARLPTLLSNKIRKGVPPPLRGVVWQSMSGSRDAALEEQFDKFCGESSPYEGIIGKDLGRSFPGVDMFRDPEGDGQRMLGRVLKCYSLHEPKIGYCQGLAFLVGPLLMHMPDKQAFCVLVKLMEDYDLRNSYTPELSGLHMRIYQFRELLRQHLPILSSHLDDLQVEPAYVSQWFLSFFAVTCPLPMLFRIYDVIFAEGASETIMRVALSLMHKNQGRILACTEMEDVLQLLLSRGLWDCYHYNADEFVQDFVGLSSVVTRARLAALEQGYREAQIANTPSTNAARTSDVTTAASRFLGRLWSSSTIGIGGAASTNSTSTTTIPKSSTPSSSSTLSPGLVAPLRPLSMLRRSASKQSLASTLNSMEASSSAASILSSASTEATTVSRDSSASDDPSARGSKPTATAASTAVNSGSNNNNSSNKNSDSRYLHSQIEDLLTALSDLQRQHSLLADQLQREREERDEDKKAVRSLLDGLRKKAGTDAVQAIAGGSSEETIQGVGENNEETPEQTRPSAPSTTTPPPSQPPAEDISELLDTVEGRFGTQAEDDRRSSIPQTKSQLRDELARAKEQLANELAKGQECNRRIYDIEQEMTTLKDQLRDSHTHVRSLHQDKQRLEKQIHGMRTRASADPGAPGGGGSSAEGSYSSDWLPKSNSAGGGGGLREFKLARSRSTPSQVSSGLSPFGKRSSSMMTVRNNNKDEGPLPENEALLLELVQAKTAEAVARQEADEARQKLESLRKAFGLAPGDTPTTATHASGIAGSAASAASAAMGMFGRFTASAAVVSSSAPADGGVRATSRDPSPAPSQKSLQTAATAPVASSGAGTMSSGGVGSFFGWRRA